MSCSFRYCAAHFARPASTGSSKTATRFVTPPVDVITTAITTCGCSISTSTCRTVAAASGGADTRASRLVSCESISVVAWSAASTSPRRAAPSSSGNSGGARLEAIEEAVDVEPIAAVRRDAARRRVRMRSAALAARARPALRGRSTATRSGRRARPASSTRQAGRWPRTPRRPAAGSPVDVRRASSSRAEFYVFAGLYAINSAATASPTKRPRGVSASVAAASTPLRSTSASASSRSSACASRVPSNRTQR